MDMRKCSKCGVTKELTPINFYRNKQSKQGYRPDCKDCRNKVNKVWATDPEVAERSRERSRKWRQDNREKHLEYCREWSRNNREVANKSARKWYHKNRKHDECYKLRRIVSTRVWEALKANKVGSTWEHLPYTPEQLKEHLQAQFDEHMTWDNYGDYWHIDHIYPQSKLPYDSMEHPNFLLCWSLDNLRPLSATENLKKSNKILDKHPQTHYIIETTTNTGENMRMISDGSLDPAPVTDEAQDNGDEQ